MQGILEGLQLGRWDRILPQVRVGLLLSLPATVDRAPILRRILQE